MDFLQKYQEKINELCRKYHVKTLHVFGSAVTDRFTDESDIDMLVLFEPIPLGEYFSNYMGFKEELEALFHRAVDLAEDQAIKNPVFRNIVDREKKMIYERKSA